MTILYQNKLFECRILKTFSDGYFIELFNQSRLYVSSFLMEMIEPELEALIDEEIYLMNLK